MRLNYRINKESFYVEFYGLIDTKLAIDIEKIKSDKKILFVHDKNISHQLIEKIYTILKTFGFKVFVVSLEGSKINKNEKSLFQIIDVMIKYELSKNSILLSCGGGVVGDISALCSSLYYRGLIYLHIPTTMTAIVDSCIGGKTAINYKNIINSFGTYYHPKKVFIYNEIINTLPDKEFFSGIPEILKCGLIKKNQILYLLKNQSDKVKQRKPKIINKLIVESLKTKIFFFKDDVNEKKDQRVILNFGHTFAHAIEMACAFHQNKDYLSHGEAVGLGMLCEINYSDKSISKNYQNVKQILEQYRLPTQLTLPNKISNKNKIHKLIVKYIFLDKKKINRYPRYIHLSKINFPKVKEIKDMSLMNETIYNIMK